MKYRKLRIAWTIGWVVACLPSLVLWAVSYTEIDHWDIRSGSSGGILVWTIAGRICADSYNGPPYSFDSAWDGENQFLMYECDQDMGWWGFQAADDFLLLPRRSYKSSL
jgi:hypothetical protein